MPYGFVNLLRALAGLLGASWLGASDTVGRDHSSLRLPREGHSSRASLVPHPALWAGSSPNLPGEELEAWGWRALAGGPEGAAGL